MFKKNVLTEQFLITDFIPTLLPIDYDKLKQHLLIAYYKNKKLGDDEVYYDYNYTKYDYHQHIQWLQDYIRDHYKVEHHKTPILINQGAIVQRENESIGNHHHIDDWDYNESPDMSALICLELGDISSNVIFEYEAGRSKKRRWSIPLQKNKIILFSSDLTHRITTNMNKDPIINLSFQFQLL
tara:strand:+ start:69 stop:617 length:549 start_codon:yes stop_codon:yes gene_type:complete